SSTGVVIRNNTLSFGRIGIRLQGGGHIISGNTISNQSEMGSTSFPFGTAIYATNAGARVEGNTMTANKWGVVIDGGPNGVDLGGGASSSAGKNSIFCNGYVGVVDTSYPVTSLFAVNNAWDHAPPTAKGDPLIGCLQGPGLDFCGIALVTGAASLANGAC